MSAPIEFKDGEKYVEVSEVTEGLCLLMFGRWGSIRQGVYVDKTLYHLLEQAMPHIRAIVDDTPEIFPGTMDALNKLTVRKE